MDRRNHIEGEIRALKNLLAETDYKILKSLEGIFDCTSATGIISFLKGLSDDIRQAAADRADWRKKINDFEAELAELDGVTASGAEDASSEFGSGATQEAEVTVEGTPDETETTVDAEEHETE